jgi:hypothetical protein
MLALARPGSSCRFKASSKPPDASEHNADGGVGNAAIRRRDRATMQFSTDHSDLVLDALRTAVARSPIVVRKRPPDLPAGFETIDAAILDWIATEARRLGAALH